MTFNGAHLLLTLAALALIAGNYWREGHHMNEPQPVRHENHDKPGADISDCPACRRKADALGVDW